MRGSAGHGTARLCDAGQGLAGFREVTPGRARQGDARGSAAVIVEVTCRGTSPLLMNKMDESTLEGLRTKRKPSKAASVGSTRTPREDAERKVYLSEEGPVLPGINLMACFIEAGKFIRLDGKRQITNAKATVLPGLVSLLTPQALLKIPDTEKAATWEADVQQGRNPNGGEAVALCRPRFDEWEFTFSIDIDEAEIGENTIRDLVDKAGRRVGIGDFRPQRKGIFGQFRVECWEHV